MGSSEMDFKNMSDEQFSIYFDFNGSATLRANWRMRRALNLELVQALNEDLSVIERQIVDGLREKLPHGVKLTVDMEFYRGSIGWEGVVVIMGGIALLADNISFFQYVAKALRFSVDRIIRSRVEQRSPIKKIKTKVTGIRGFRPQAAMQVVPNVAFDQASSVSRFLWWCSGAVPEIIQKATVDHSKYFGIGGAVLTTGVLAFFSSAYAAYTVFEGSVYQILISLLLGLIWALAIFNLDRYLVSSMKKEEDRSPRSFLKELARASPRLLLAIVIGVTISKPLELRLFKGPIDERFEIRRGSVIKEKENSIRSVFAARFAEIDKEIARVEGYAANWEVRIRHLEDEHSREVDGTGGSKKPGTGRVAEAKLAVVNHARTELARLENRISNLIARRQNTETQIKSRVQEFEERQKLDFSERMMILADLAHGNQSVRWSKYFIVALLVLVEMSPVLVKLLAPIGVYDVRLNIRSDMEFREAERKGRAMSEVMAYHYHLLVGSEMRAEAKFNSVRDEIREERLAQLPNQWRSPNANGREPSLPSLDELEELVRNDIFSNRET